MKQNQNLSLSPSQANALTKVANVHPFFAPDNLDVCHAKQKKFDRKGGDKCQQPLATCSLVAMTLFREVKHVGFQGFQMTDGKQLLFHGKEL